MRTILFTLSNRPMTSLPTWPFDAPLRIDLVITNRRNPSRGREACALLCEVTTHAAVTVLVLVPRAGIHRYSNYMLMFTVCRVSWCYITRQFLKCGSDFHCQFTARQFVVLPVHGDPMDLTGDTRNFQQMLMKRYWNP